ncbi:MAG: sigma-70 family RNA polymerase sigma factor [Phycisphaerae bacterium]|nr:sigma-70 family RNA polymerase sigma factor [Phycisphaerae bacterium]MBT5365396.1 sigma-70 family RNA polymerase sigma factor [Phycisphaerae bacterium]MBT6269949.1 sigma-70 family RNA polymerase sigma factor [Phycisphaerae bacterium]MBT6282016.1 sigma-70 family RNA polymerase sigma factor [Phycisphaerae bacterium]
MPNNEPDYRLMRRVALGEEDAVAELYDRYCALVFKLSLQFLSNNAEAEDAVQEVFVRLWKTADRFDPRKAKLVTWVMLITRRHLIDRIRRKMVRPKQQEFTEHHEVSATDTPLPSNTLLHERNALLWQALQALPEMQRTVIERAYFHGFTLREVSKQLDAPLGTVKSALSRGLLRLREHKSKKISAQL